MHRLPERIRKWVKMADNGCMEWQGSSRLNRCGNRYGRIYVLGSSATGKNLYEKVTHTVYRQAKGEIPEGMCVCHTCDNTLCVNPDHLWLGTHSENMKDAYRKGRVTPPEQHMFGEGNPNSKLTALQVQEIRECIKQGDSQRTIAREFGVCKATIQQIAHNKTWDNIGGA